MRFIYIFYNYDQANIFFVIQAERMKLERDKQELTNKNKTLNLNSER